MSDVRPAQVRSRPWRKKRIAAPPSAERCDSHRGIPNPPAGTNDIARATPREVVRRPLRDKTIAVGWDVLDRTRAPGGHTRARRPSATRRRTPTTADAPTDGARADGPHESGGRASRLCRSERQRPENNVIGIEAEDYRIGIGGRTEIEMAGTEESAATKPASTESEAVSRVKRGRKK